MHTQTHMYVCMYVCADVIYFLRVIIPRTQMVFKDDIFRSIADAVNLWSQMICKGACIHTEV